MLESILEAYKTRTVRVDDGFNIGFNVGREHVLIGRDERRGQLGNEAVGLALYPAVHHTSPTSRIHASTLVGRSSYVTRPRPSFLQEPIALVGRINYLSLHGCGS